VVVTGGASGMGAASARLFEDDGDTVIVVDLQDGGPNAIVGDVSDSHTCTSIVDKIVEEHGRIDVLVNAAGTIHRAGAAGTADADWERVMGVNVNGTFYMCRATLRHMVAAGQGAIVNFGSIWGDVGAAGVTAYCTSKGAVHQLTRALALDHADDGVRINAVAPGEVNTPMLSSQRATPPTPADLAALAEATIPVKRLAEPHEIAEMVRFLASDRASYMTGAVVPVDGGYTAR
jgi:NAD(P)-dependent dehydrogenase (short-subunit alcohol dehydrogenase family)